MYLHFKLEQLEGKITKEKIHVFQYFQCMAYGVEKLLFNQVSKLILKITMSLSTQKMSTKAILGNFILRKSIWKNY